MSEIRKVLTSQLQACRGEGLFSGLPPGRVWSLGAAPTLGPPGSWRGGHTAPDPDRTGPLSPQRPASTAPSSSPRACPCPHQLAPGEARRMRGSKWEPANPRHRVSWSPSPLPRARGCVPGSHAAGQSQQVSIKACASCPSLRQRPVPLSLFSPGEGAETPSRSARGGWHPESSPTPTCQSWQRPGGRVLGARWLRAVGPTAHGQMGTRGPISHWPHYVSSALLFPLLLYPSTIYLFTVFYVSQV